jgi:hypothetical protein
LLAWLTLDRLMTGVLFMLVFAAAACTALQSDTWWQLRSGELIMRTGSVWTVDPFSSTARGAPWPNHEWLAQVIFYATYMLAGLKGLVLLCAGIATATWLIIYRLCAGLPRYRAVLLLSVVVSHEIVWAIRPHMITLLFAALTLLFIRRRHLHWFLPPLFLLWANLHGGVVVGGLALVVAMVAALLCQRDDFWRWFRITIACAVATLVNPMGLGLWRFALSMFNHPETQYIQEWLPPSVSWPLSYPFFVLALVWLVVIGLRWRHLRSFDDWFFVLLGLAWLFLGSRAIRHTPLFTIAALPLISQMLTFAPHSSANTVETRRGTLHLALGGLIACGCVALVAQVWGDNGHMRWAPLAPGSIAAVRSCPGPLYNTYTTGGALLWFVPEQPVFVDSRNDPYPLTLLFRAVIVEQQGDYRELFHEYGIACALVPIQKPIYSALRNDPEWQEVYRDAELAVLRRGRDPVSTVR